MSSDTASKPKPASLKDVPDELVDAIRGRVLVYKLELRADELTKDASVLGLETVGAAGKGIARQLEGLVQLGVVIKRGWIPAHGDEFRPDSDPAKDLPKFALLYKRAETVCRAFQSGFTAEEIDDLARLFARHGATHETFSRLVQADTELTKGQQNQLINKFADEMSVEFDKEMRGWERFQGHNGDELQNPATQELVRQLRVCVGLAPIPEGPGLAG